MTHYIVARGSEIKFAIPENRLRLLDGCVWVEAIPLLGIIDPKEIARCKLLVGQQKFEEIPADYYCHMGENANGVWVGTKEEFWERQKKQESKPKTRTTKVEIALSTRGWGDYSSLVWEGDITQPQSDIVAQCQAKISKSNDLDKIPTEAELISMIIAARETWDAEPERVAAFEKAEKEDREHKKSTGYCYACKSWCCGDCGNYNPNPPAFRAEIEEFIND